MRTLDAGAPSRAPSRASSRYAALLTPRRQTLIAFGVIAVAIALPLRGLMRFQGPPMEEGFMLVFPERVLHGSIPNRDFLHLYGPGSLWVLAGWYKLFGVNLYVERTFALLQQLGVVLGVYGIARYWGRAIALCCALTSLVIILPPIGLTALAWVGGVALGLLAVLVALESRRRVPDDERRAARWALGAGLLVGAALLYRPDLIVATGLGVGAAVWRLGTRVRNRVLIGALIGVSPYAIHVAMAGPGNVFRGLVLDPVVYLRGGRRLPIPPPWNRLDGFLQRASATQHISWPIPALSTSQELFVWFFALLLTIAFLVFAGVLAVRRAPERFEARALLAASLFSVGLIPQAVQRVDSAHFAWVSCVPVALLPIGIVEVLRLRRPDVPRLRRTVRAGVAVLAGTCLIVPFFTARSYTDFTLETFGRDRRAEKVERNGRVFYYGRADVVRAARAAIVDIPELVPRGGRLFVGTTDLRKTPYSDAYLYYLLPEYPPATYYIEMDPGVANRKGSRLASDLRSADVAILSSVWEAWSEPNDSRKFGSAVPNEVLHRDFCRVAYYARDYELWLRRRGSTTCEDIRARARTVMVRNGHAADITTT